MNEKYLKDLYGWIGQKDTTFPTDVPFEKFAQKMQDESYAKQMHDWIGTKDPTFKIDVPFDDFVKKTSSSAAPASWAGVPESAKFGGAKPTDVEELKKKEQPITTASSSAASSSASLSQKPPKEEGFLHKAKRALEKGAEMNYAYAAGIGKNLLEWYDSAIEATSKALGGPKEEKQLTPEEQKVKQFKDKFGLPQGDQRNVSPLDPRAILSNAGNIASKIINSTIPQEQKNKLIERLNLASNTVKTDIKSIEDFQDRVLPKNIPSKVVQNIIEMTPELLVAGAMENPAMIESKLAQLTEKATKKAAPIVQKYAPKAAKVLEESIVAPFTKIMAVKGGLKAAAETKEGENVAWNAIEGSAKGALEGMEMHGLGVTAGKVATPIARGISKTGINSAISTAIAAPLANAGVFTTARALRTGIQQGRALTPEEIGMEAGTGVGFSLLHLKSQFDNQNEANHYYDNVLSDDRKYTLSRVLNETKANLDLAYNPDLTPEGIKKLQEARDEIKKAILKEPDMQKKKELGDEAVKIQNALDAHFIITHVVEDPELFASKINELDGLTPEQKKFYSNKVKAIADAYDMSDFAVGKRELNTKITEAQAALDEAGKNFTDAKTPFDRAKAKLEVDKRRQELEGLNGQLTELITNKQEQDAIQKQKSDEALLRAGEQKLGLQKMGEGDTKPELTPEQSQLIEDEKQKWQEALDNPEDDLDLQDAQEYFDNPVQFLEKRVAEWEYLVKEDPTEQPTLDFVKAKLEAHKAAEAKPEVKTELTELEKKREEEIRKRGLDRLFPVEIDESTPEGKKLAEEKLAQDKAISELDAELAKEAKPTSVTTAEAPETKTGGIEIKTVKNEDNEHSVLLNGEEIGKIYYDPSQKTWNNANFSRQSEKPYTSKWIYGDVLGESKQAAIDEIVRRHKESAPKKEEPQKVEYTKDNILNRFLNKLNDIKNLIKNPINPRELIYDNKSALEFNRFDKGDNNEISLQDISVLDKGKGIGKSVMKDITDAADASGVTLTLDAKPFGKDGLSKEQLIDFYKKNGFVPDLENAFGGEFKTEKELIDYVLKNESEALPMKREPKEIKEEVTTKEEPITIGAESATATTAEVTAVTTTKEGTETSAISKTQEYQDMMDNIEFLVPKSKEYVERALRKAKVTGKGLDKARADYEEYKKDVDKARKDAVEMLENSDLYKKADQIEQDEMMRELSKKFGEPQKRSPKPEELFGNVTETNRIMEELNFLFDDANKSKDYLDEQYKKAKEALDKNPTSQKLKDNLAKAKADVEEYKIKNIDLALEKLKESESYKNASPEQQAKMEKYLTDKFLKSQTSKILPTKLFENVVEGKKITTTEKKAWIDQLKHWAKGQKNAIDATKAMMNEIRSAISELSKKGNITAKQADTIINKMAALKITNEKGISKFIDYVSKVFADAEYGSKLSKANETRASISKLAGVKGKDPYLSTLAREFKNIKPSMVDDIDVYNDMASKIKESLVGSEAGNKENPLKVAEMVNVAEASEYVKDQLAKQEKALYDEKLAEMNELFDTDFTGATLEQLIELAKSDKPIDKEKETIIRDAIKKMFDVNSTIINSIIETGKDPFTGEDINLSKEDIRLIKEFMGMDLNRLNIKESLEFIDKLSNFLQNGSTANMETIVETYKGKLNAEELAKKGLESKALKFYGSELLGRNFTQQLATLPMMLETMFKGVKRSMLFEDKSGIADLANAKTFAQASSIRMSNEYVDKFYERKANGKDFADQSNIVERGIIAALKRTVMGTPEQQQAEFNRKKGLIEKTIDELRTGNEKERALSKLYEEAYDKVLDGSENISDVIKKSDKNNVEAVDWWIDKWSDVYQKLSDVSKNVYNEILDKDMFYTPDRFSKISNRGNPEDILDSEKSRFHSNHDNSVYKKKTGSLEKATKPGELPVNEDKEVSRFLDLSFDKNNVNAMYDALMDVHTAGIVRRIEAFFKSPEIKKIIPSAEDRNLLYNSDGNGSVQEFIRRTRGKEIIESSEVNSLVRKLNSISSIGVSAALGSVYNIAKQTVPVGLNTLINTGGTLDLGYKSSEKADFMDRIGYGISVRGLESQGQISSINKLIDLASKSGPDKALEYIDKAGRQWLKWCLANPDVFIAKASWISYYEKSLKEQGVDLSTIDYKTHDLNDDPRYKEAANYAQKMVDRQQNISDTDLQGKLLGTKDVGKRAVTKMMMAFASFRINQFMRAKSDLSVIFSKDKMVSEEDRRIAANSLKGYSAEMIMYKAMVVGISAITMYLSNKVMGKKENEEDAKKRWNNILRSQITGTVTDVFSPIPTHIVDQAYAYGADVALDKLQSIFNVKDEDRFKLMTSSKYNDLQSLGVYGIGAQKVKSLIEVEELARTGEFTDEYGRKKYISQSDREALKPLVLMSLLSTVNILPADPNTITKDAVKSAKMDASSKEGGKTDEDLEIDEQAREQRELSKEERAQQRQEKAVALNDLIQQGNLDENKAGIMQRKIKEYTMDDEQMKKYREDTRNERFKKKQEMEVLLGKYDSKSDMKRYDPALYEERFGEASKWYQDNKDEIEVEKLLNEEIRRRKDINEGYVGKDDKENGFGPQETKRKNKRKKRSFSEYRFMKQ